MGVSRSGYYKWRKRDKSTRDLRREEVIALVSEVHKAHPSHGYRWVAAFIRVNYQQDISDNYVYKAFRFLGIKAKTKHQVHYRPRKIRDLYPNLIFTTWDTVDRPRQVIVSDMTVLKPWIFYLELTLYFDVFTKQILTWKLSERRGGREQYLDGLADVVELLRGKKEPTIIHTDQGSVYSSKAYNELIQDCNVVRSMSRAGKPTDNPVNEALNGWIKEELFIDFRLEECRTRDAVKDVLCRYVAFYNRQRPCFAIGYDTPDNYCKRFYRGELEKKDTFSKRILTEEPKFVQKRKIQKNNSVPCLLLILSLYSIQNCYPLQTGTLQGFESSCPLLKKDFGKNYCPCPLLKKQLLQKYSSCLLLKKQIKNKYFSCLLFLTTTK